MKCLGSTRGSRVGDGVLAIADFLLLPALRSPCFQRGRRNLHARRVRSPENDNAVTFAPPLCCRKSLTNSERVVVKGTRIVDLGTMRLSLLIAACCTAALAANAQVNVTQKNNHLSRDGLYIDGAFTPGNATNLTRDMNFNGTIVGNVHAQPLYIEGGNGPMVIVVTASNNVYALNANTGFPIWSRTDIGPAISTRLASLALQLSISTPDRSSSTR
jgi:hypothetical protein